jgi:hypothetical protein
VVLAERGCPAKQGGSDDQLPYWVGRGGVSRGLKLPVYGTCFALSCLQTFANCNVFALLLLTLRPTTFLNTRG